MSLTVGIILGVIAVIVTLTVVIWILARAAGKTFAAFVIKPWVKGNFGPRDR